MVPNLYDVEWWNDPPIDECEEHTHFANTFVIYNFVYGVWCLVYSTGHQKRSRNLGWGWISSSFFF